ncbi:MAG: TolC family protein [Bacteriovoracaceae bacterium]|jgi:outer membrane protein, heavy metal efflux system|nr:TolC family protein [Bacteriovoracaceae bacterium]
MTNGNEGIWMYFKYLILLMLSYNAFADDISFNAYVAQIEKHSSVLAIKLDSEKLKEEGLVESSWGDPTFHVSAINFPEKSIHRNKSPMTAIKYSLSQKIALTNKFGNMKEAFDLAADGRKLDADNQKKIFIKTLWIIAIEKRRILSDLKIYNENSEWVENTLTISKKLYTNGRIGQQALLDIQIRKSDLETMIFNEEASLKIINSKLSFFNNNYTTIDLATVPWGLLDEEKIGSDYVEYSLKKNLASKEKLLLAHYKNIIPDVTVGFSYTNRNDLDGLGDFVGLSISFPFPLSGSKYGNHNMAVQERAIADYSYRSYKSLKRAKVKEYSHIIEKINNELDNLVNKSKGYALNSREIKSKSYRLGKSTYYELLNSELQLQKILLKENELRSLLAQIKIERNYLKGAALYEATK